LRRRLGQARSSQIVDNTHFLERFLLHSRFTEHQFSLDKTILASDTAGDRIRSSLAVIVIVVVVAATSFWSIPLLLGLAVWKRSPLPAP